MGLNDLPLDQYGIWQGTGLEYYSEINRCWMPITYLDAGTLGGSIRMEALHPEGGTCTLIVHPIYASEMQFRECE